MAEPEDAREVVYVKFEHVQSISVDSVETTSRGTLRPVSSLLLGLVSLVLVASVLRPPARPEIARWSSLHWIPEAEHCDSFPQLAAAHVGDAARSLSPALAAALTAECQPNDVRTARKLTLRLRNLLDVFSPVFPPDSGATHDDGLALRWRDGDMWMRARDLLDRGYEALGVFQDLEHSGVAYTRADVEARRRTVLDWYADWRAAEARARPLRREYGDGVVC